MKFASTLLGHIAEPLHSRGTCLMVPLSLFVGAGLGAFDPRAVAALRLPQSSTSGKGSPAPERPLTVDAKKPDGAAMAESSKDKPKPGDATSLEVKEVRKISMGVTLPTVPARLVKRILSGEFVDMGELSQEVLRAEFKRATDGEDQKPSKAKPFRPVANRDAWVSGFAQYASVICRSHPEKAVALWGHLAIVMSCQNHSTTGWWKNYDTSLRHSYSSMEEADFCLNQCLFTQAMVEGSESLQRPPHSLAQPGPVRAKRRRVQACFAWNDGRPCASHPCRFAHCCAKCGGDHARRFCTTGPEGEEPRPLSQN